MQARISKAPDVVVIGSGFAGAVMAARLIDAGKTVVVLERGPWRDTLATRAAGIKHRKKLPSEGGWLGLLRSVHGSYGPKKGLLVNKYGYMEMWHGDGIQAPCTSNVGGGSHIWAAMMDRPNAEFWDNRARGLSAASMAAHYDRVQADLLATYPADSATVPNHTDHAWANEAYFAPLAPGDQPPMGLLYPKTDGDTAVVTDLNGLPRKPMSYTRAPGKFGDPSGAKTTVDAVYLLPGLRKGLEVRAMHEVALITRLSDGSYEITGKDLRRRRRFSIKAGTVVVAAGTMNTNSLLRRSVDAQALGDMPSLGQGIGANGDLICGWPVPADGSRDASVGTPVQGRIKIKGHEEAGYMILSGGEPTPVPWFQRKKAEAKARSKYNVIAMTQDAADGVFWSDKGRDRFRFSLAGSPSYAKAMAAMDALATMSGRPLKFDRSAVFTAHPMGGCRVSDDPSIGVVNGEGVVHGHPGLIVADASIFPQPVGVPPSLSIAAFASHAAAALIARLA